MDPMNQRRCETRSNARRRRATPVFATPEIDRYVAFKERPIVPPTEVGLTVTYVGSEEKGIPFRAWLVGSLEP